MMRSTMSSEIENTRTAVDSRKMAKWVRHGALILLFKFKSCCWLDVVKRYSHLCLLLHDFIRLWTNESNICMEKELEGVICA